MASEKASALSKIEELPEVKQVVSRVDVLDSKYSKYVVQNNDQYEASADDLKAIKTAAHAIEQEKDKIVVPLYQAYKAALDFFNKPLKKLEQVEARIKSALRSYHETLERARQEQQRIADAAATKERERLQALAARQAAAGRDGKAEETMQRASQVVAHVPVVETPKAQGVVYRDNWVFRVKDINKVPRQFLMLDEAKIGKLVKSMKLEAIPLLGGDDAIEIKNERIIASGRS